MVHKFSVITDFFTKAFLIQWVFLSYSRAVEEMYNSVISAYELRVKELCTELNAFRQCIQSVISEIMEIVSVLQVCVIKHSHFIF